MRKPLNKKTKTAALVAAVCFSALLLVWWSIAAFITVNDVSTGDYEGQKTTRVVSFQTEDIDDPSFYGIALRAEDEDFDSNVSKVKESGKVAFILIEKLSDDEVTPFFTRCYSALSRKKIVFCSTDRKTLQRLLSSQRTVNCLLLTDTVSGAYMGNRMGYNCSLPFEKWNEKRIDRAHENEHYVAAWGVKKDDLGACKALGIDFAFLVE